MSIFKKKNVVAVPAEDYEDAVNYIRELYEAAHARQKSPDAKPSEYMRGLADALAVLDDLQPRAL